MIRKIASHDDIDENREALRTALKAFMNGGRLQISVDAEPAVRTGQLPFDETIHDDFYDFALCFDNLKHKWDSASHKLSMITSAITSVFLCAASLQLSGSKKFGTMYSFLFWKCSSYRSRPKFIVAGREEGGGGRVL